MTCNTGLTVSDWVEVLVAWWWSSLGSVGHSLGGTTGGASIALDLHHSDQYPVPGHNLGVRHYICPKKYININMY